jgi:hypothetical protein
MSDYDLGKKVFFLHPPSVIKDELISRLLEQEYEVYMLKDLEMTERLLLKYPNSIVFVNIDLGQSEGEWETWIRKIMASDSTSGVGFGILSYNTDESLQKKYLMDIGIQCGFVKLKLGLEESTRILLATLQANEAKGRRKYVRANCRHDAVSSLNFVEGPHKGTGKLMDISVVGFSCILDPDPVFSKNTVLHDIQIRLRASLVRVQAVIYGTREEEGRKVYVCLLSPKTEQPMKDKIRTYIQGALQSEIELEGALMQKTEGTEQPQT